VALYTGRIRTELQVHGDRTDFIIQANIKDKKVYLDGKGMAKGAGQLINDACDLYGSIKVSLKGTR